MEGKMARRITRMIVLTVCLLSSVITVRSTFAQSQTCDATPIIFGNGFPEVQGASDNAELWGLIFQRLPLHAEREVKIVWRMTNIEDSIEVSAEDEYSISILPIWGPEEHGGSTWTHPGREWGTGFIFPHAGCWMVKLVAGEVSGQVKFDVQSAFLWI
jgi:hypothetical protein